LKEVSDEKIPSEVERAHIEKKSARRSENYSTNVES